MTAEIIKDMSGEGLVRGTIVKGIAGFYYVKSGDAVYRCKARGVFKQRDIKPAVGDDVTVEVIPGNDDSLITEVMPRKNSFIRPFVANVDCFAVVTAAIRPEPVLDILDKFLVTAEKAGTDIVLCVNKCDAAADDGTKGKRAKVNIETIKSIYGSLYPVICLDSKNVTGFDELRELIAGRRTALAGPSGVGKSTILNILLPGAEAETGAISERSQRGKHTTRHTELFTIDEKRGTRVFDTPGFTSFDIRDISEDELQYMFPEIGARAGGCRYRDCRHLTEPGCEIIAALERGEISESRYASYRSMLEDIERSKQY